MNTQTDNVASLECTLDQLAALAGVSSRHCRRLLGETPQSRRGRWALGPAFAAMLDGMSGGASSADLTAQRVRLVKAQADTAEMKFLEAKSELAPIEQMARIWELRCAIIRENILRVPARSILQLLNEGDEATWKAKLRAELVLALEQARDTEIKSEQLEGPDEIEPEEDTE